VCALFITHVSECVKRIAFAGPIQEDVC